MLDQARRRLTYANVMSTLAAFIALGGSSYAAVKLNGKNITTRSISATKLKRNTLTGLEIRETQLGRVPRAQRADSAATLNGATADAFTISCPDDTFQAADVCVEKTPRAPVAYSTALLECHPTNPLVTGDRRLPTHGELRIALATVEIAAGGELTSDVTASPTRPGELDVLAVIDEIGTVAVVPDNFSGRRAFRCVTDPFPVARRFAKAR